MLDSTRSWLAIAAEERIKIAGSYTESTSLTLGRAIRQFKRTSTQLIFDREIGGIIEYVAWFTTEQSIVSKLNRDIVKWNVCSSVKESDSAMGYLKYRYQIFWVLR